MNRLFLGCSDVVKMVKENLLSKEKQRICMCLFTDYAN